MDPWPHQERGVQGVEDAIAAGDRCICLTSPTGMGKSRMACELIDRWATQGLKVSVYTNRKFLVEQLSGVLEAHGLKFGVRAAGHASEHGEPVQISSIQTEHARCEKKKVWTLHQADRVLVDEVHNLTGNAALGILKQHVAAGAAVVGLTATPIGLYGVLDRLIVAGNVSEGRRCGALVPCRHYGPDEPDLKRIGKVPLGQDIPENRIRKAMMVEGIFGRVWDHFERLNPEHLPTILFAPGVPESVWFAERFSERGVRAAHIDGDEVWLDGEFIRSDKDARRAVLAGSREGGIKVICHRFVLREGLDMPWLRHGIFATVFGSLQSYLQSGGRLLRAHPGKQYVTLQDHGGSWWRHGSLNADREWHLDWTGAMVAGMREERLRAKKCLSCGRPLLGPKCPCGINNEVEPNRCVGCGAVVNGPVCPFCAGKAIKSRPVVMADGTLREMKGDIYRPRRLTKAPNAAALWKQMYYRARSKSWDATFRQAEAMFAQENNWSYPPRDLPLMPKEFEDFYRKVSEVPYERLIPNQPKE